MPTTDVDIDRTPLVMLPGLLCDARLWQAQVEAIADIAAPIVADLTLDDDIGVMARRILERMPPRFAVAALSMGGYVAFELMRQAPERITRLALFSTSAGLDDSTRHAERQRSVEILRHGRFLGVSRFMLPQLIHPSCVDGTVGALVQDMAITVGREAFLRQQHAIMARSDSRPLLGQIACPTLVAVGTDDLVTPPAEARTIAQGIAGARLHLIAECGHLPPIERPDETSRLLREWLLGQD